MKSIQLTDVRRTCTRLILPEICPACQAAPLMPDRKICPSCASRLQPLPLPRCPLCGGTIEGVLDVCAECLAGPERPWRQAVSVFPYGGDIRELIHRFKYNRAVYLTPVMADWMAQAWFKYGDGEPDAISFVSMHWLRKWRRGYNQAELLADWICKTMNKPVYKLVRRRKNSRKQVTLSKTKRRKNLTSVFAPANPQLIRDKHILVVDDVFTTGSTLHAVTQTILTCQPSHVSVLTLARG